MISACDTFDYSFAKEQDLNKCRRRSEEIALIWLFGPKKKLIIFLAASISCESFALRVQIAKKFSLFFLLCALMNTKIILINKTLRKELVSLFEKEFEWRCINVCAVFLFEMHCWTKIFALYFHPIAALERVDFTSLISKGKQRRMSQVPECIFVNDLLRQCEFSKFEWWKVSGIFEQLNTGLSESIRRRKNSFKRFLMISGFETEKSMNRSFFRGKLSQETEFFTNDFSSILKLENNKTSQQFWTIFKSFFDTFCYKQCHKNTFPFHHFPLKFLSFMWLSTSQAFSIDYFPIPFDNKSWFCRSTSAITLQIEVNSRMHVTIL